MEINKQVKESGQHRITELLEDIEKTREELYEYISKYTLCDDRTIRKSQELDTKLNFLSANLLYSIV